MTTTLVTGGLGFLGAALVRALVARGGHVRVLDDGSRGAHRRLEDLSRAVEFVTADVRDRAAARRAVEGVDAVWHLAAINGTRHFYERPGAVLEVGLKGTLNVVEASAESGVQDLFLASSSEVYHEAPRVPADETVPLTIPDIQNPRYSYAVAKLAGEAWALHWPGDRIKRVVVFRPHNVYGPDMGDDHVVPALIQRLAELRAKSHGGRVRLPIQGSGTETRAFAYIDDVVRGLMVLADRGEHREIYHVGNPHETTIRALAQTLGRLMEVDVEILPSAPAAGAPNRRCPDISKLARLGYQPTVALEDGLRRTISWYLEQPTPTVSPKGSR